MHTCFHDWLIFGKYAWIYLSNIYIFPYDTFVLHYLYFFNTPSAISWKWTMARFCSLSPKNSKVTSLDHSIIHETKVTNHLETWQDNFTRVVLTSMDLTVSTCEKYLSNTPVVEFRLCILCNVCDWLLLIIKMISLSHTYWKTYDYCPAIKNCKHK